jgi:ketosteroid isomerase-like protein
VASDNLAIVRALIEALNRLDLDDYLGLCHEDVELISPLSPIEGPSVGADGVRRFFATIEQGSQTFRVDIDSFEDIGGGRVLGFGKLHATSQGGISLDRPIANLYELADGRLRRVQAFEDPASARAAAADR